MLEEYPGSSAEAEPQQAAESFAPEDEMASAHVDQRDDRGRLDKATALMQAEILQNDPDFMLAISERAAAAKRLANPKAKYDEIRDEFEPVAQDYAERWDSLNNMRARLSRLGGSSSPQLSREFDSLSQERANDSKYQEGKKLKEEVDRIENRINSERSIARMRELQTLYDAHPGWVAMLEKSEYAIYAWELFPELHDANPDILAMPAGEYLRKAKELYPVEREANFAETCVTKSQAVLDGLEVAKSGELDKDDQTYKDYSLKIKSPSDIFYAITRNLRPAGLHGAGMVGADWWEAGRISTDVFDANKEYDTLMGSIDNNSTFIEVYDKLIDLAKRVVSARAEKAQPFIQKRLKARQALVDWHPSDSSSVTQ